jgi:hypothetical protein
VIASTWRSTQILTIANNVVVLPNSTLAKLGLTNVSRPAETHLLQLSVRIKPTKPPLLIEEALTIALAGCNLILKDPAPMVALKGIDATAVDVDLYARVKDPMRMAKARNEVIDLLHRHCKAAGLHFAPSASSVLFREQSRTADLEHPVQERFIELIDQTAIFESLDKAEKDLLAHAAVSRVYPQGASITHQGHQLTSIMVVASGVVAVLRDGSEQRRLSPGDFYGDAGLLSGSPKDCSLTAISPVKIWEIGHDDLSNLFKNRPELVNEISARLSAHDEDARHAAHSEATDGHTPRALLKSIRTIFTN